MTHTKIEDRRQAEHDRRVLLTSTRLSGERRQDDQWRRRIAQNVKENGIPSPLETTPS